MNRANRIYNLEKRHRDLENLIKQGAQEHMSHEQILSLKKLKFYIKQEIETLKMSF